MILKYANYLVHNMVLCDPSTCVCKFILDQEYSDYTYIIQYFGMYGLEICMKVNTYAAPMFYSCSFSHNAEVTIATKQRKYFLSLETYVTVFDWGSRN